MPYDMLNIFIFLLFIYYRWVEIDQSVRTRRSGDRNRVGVEGRFAAHVQTGPRPHSVFSTMGTGSLSQR
jgi:hypothetical protein